MGGEHVKIKERVAYLNQRMAQSVNKGTSPG